MTDGWTFFFNLIPVYRYHIIPACLSAILFLSFLFSQQRKNLISIILQIATVFSITLTVEYLLIFLIFGTLHGTIGLFEKIVLGLGIIFTLLIVVRESSKGTNFGKLISRLLEKFSYFEENVIPVGPFTEQLTKLQLLNDKIQIGDRNQISSAYSEFVHYGEQILTLLCRTPEIGRDRCQEAKNMFDDCEACFKEICYQPENMCGPFAKTKATVAVSKFIGLIEGLNHLKTNNR